MSSLRQEIDRWTGKASYSPTGATAYLMIYNGVKAKHGLIAGRLHSHGESCAIGSYYDANSECGLASDIIDEVAAVNDSFKGTERERRLHMLRWLRWKLGSLGMPGFVAAAATKPKSTTR